MSIKEKVLEDLQKANEKMIGIQSEVLSPAVFEKMKQQLSLMPSCELDSDLLVALKQNSMRVGFSFAMAAVEVSLNERECEYSETKKEKSKG